ncbi:MAG: ATP-dependent DNA helicase UvrD2 [Acidimicrobiia bacterium]
MTAPGPVELGRSVVVGAGASPPVPWADVEPIIIDERALGDQRALAELTSRAQRRYVGRLPTVFVLEVEPEELSRSEATSLPPYELGATFSFLRERLMKALWHNSYDARADTPIWWWAHKAEDRLGMRIGGPADVIDEDGRPVWIDGGPRQPLTLEGIVIHHESVDLGRATPVPTRRWSMEGLADDQAKAVRHLAGPARVVAPAGSGKTLVLTSRIRHLIQDRLVEPELLTALAYNRRAAEDMALRLPSTVRPDVRTIHSLGWEILRMAKPTLRLIGESEQRRLLEPIAPAPPRANTDVIGPYLEALDEVRIGLRHPDDVEIGRDDVPAFAETFHRYRAALERRGEADHSEQIYGAIEALCRLPGLRAHWQDRCRHLLVDEFQDLTPAYLLLIRLISSPGLNVFGVGDDDQVIYGYAGANPEFLIDYESLFPGAVSHALEVNYRCPTDVVDAARNLVGYNSRRVTKTIRAANAEHGLQVITRPGDALAPATVEHVRQLIEIGRSPSSISVLARVNSSLLPVQLCLTEAGIPFDTPLEESLLDRTVLRSALAWIRIAVDPEAMSRNDLFEAIRRPGRGITRLFTEMIGRRRGPFSVADLSELGGALDGGRSARWNRFCDDIVTVSASTRSSAHLLEVLIDDIGLDKAASALDAGRGRADRAAQGDDLIALRRASAFGPVPEQFEGWLRSSLRAPKDESGVTLSTVHRVKGLEWDHVLVFGVDEGTMPHDLSADVEEERRVFHVAITRGRKTVSIFADVKRPSRFLTEIDGSAPVPRPSESHRDLPAADSPSKDSIHVSPGDVITVGGGYEGSVDEILVTGVLVKLGAATMAVPWGEKVIKAGVSGRLTPGLADASPATVERLRAWRLEQARRQGVPAYVVFNDRTLESLASARPGTEEALLQIPGIGPAKLDAYGDQLLDLLSLD